MNLYKDMTLENIVCNLPETPEFVRLDSICYAYEIMTERRTNKSLRDLHFSPADGILYFFDNVRGLPILAITTKENNLVLNNPFDATMHMYTNNSYFPEQQEAEKVINARSTVLIDLTKIRLTGGNEKLGLVEVGTCPSTYNLLNSEEKKLTERIYGKGEDFIMNMEMLNHAGITKTTITVLRPDYIQRKAQEKSIGLISRLYGFDNSSDFDACDFRPAVKVCVRGTPQLSAVGKNRILSDYTHREKVINTFNLPPIDNPGTYSRTGWNGKEYTIVTTGGRSLGVLSRIHLRRYNPNGGVNDEAIYDG